MTGHTPGPWVLKKYDAGELCVWSERLGQICEVEPVSSVSEQMATARLIAAAPDMRAELLKIEWIHVGNLDDQCPCCWAFKSKGHKKRCTLAAAIAKAT